MPCTTIRRVTAVDLIPATNDAPAPLPLAAISHAPIALPFAGSMDSYQFLGLGRLDVAQSMCAARAFQPVACGPDKALIQLSFLHWKSSPVGPYCSSFAGLVVAPRATDAAPAPHRWRAQERRPRLPLPRAARVLLAFLQSPPRLFVPTYVVGDAPGGPSGCGAASQRFGWKSLDMHKQPGRFVLARRDGVTHLQALESQRDDSGRTFVTGYSLSLRAPASGGARFQLPLSPSLLPCVPALAAKATRAARTQGAQAGAILVDALSRPGATSHIATRFTTRPRMHDLTADSQAAFAPLALQRPAPATTLGAILERLAFEPLVALCDPGMTGSILGPIPRLEDTLG